MPVEPTVKVEGLQTRGFDGIKAGNSCVTGFVVDLRRSVVDSEKGDILTPYHGVGSVAGCSFANFHGNTRQKLNLKLGDPSANFTIWSFEQTKVGVTSLRLCPDNAKANLEIRVVGYYADKKPNIFQGIISYELGPPKHHHSFYGFNVPHWNVTYTDIPPSTRGGSPGSPVVDEMGNAVGMLVAVGPYAWATGSISLEAPLRAFRCLQEGKQFRRGDVQCRFGHTIQKGTDLVRVDKVLPMGVSDGKLEVGDYLTHVDAEIVTSLDVDQYFDGKIDKDVELVLLRNEREVRVTI
ncbi:Uu.00g133990.m01.CDS01 [Anthostomella pinea]|uniref:Uu.00g133990.m01.CDS01 n=1 Tax=Anthostomella pinea TaxID=933095 RepID=A0AAI8YKW7_9PEZI|nr:Uu.00g133990.m01.CDS01 [Anthostomella pinea]